MSVPTYEKVARAAAARLRRVGDRLYWIGYLAISIPPYRTARAALRSANVIDEEELRSQRRSDTVFVFGSSASLNDLSPAEWETFAKHDTFGFNWFVWQRFVRCDFHLIRQIADSNERVVWEPQTRQYFELLEAPEFERTTLLVQHELRARGVNLAFELGVFPIHRRVFLWQTAGGEHLSRSFAAGLSHARSTVADAVNAAYLMGWRRIVLVGVDLYDRRYFWLPHDEVRPLDAARHAGADDPHSQAGTGLIELLGGWRDQMLREGVELEVYNPRSLLARVLPVYER